MKTYHEIFGKLIEKNKITITKKIENENILITSFKRKNNFSRLLLHKIITSKSIDKIKLTNSFKTSETELAKKLKNNYKYVISLGQKNRVNDVYIELKAKKHNTILNTNFPIKKIKKIFKNNNIDYSISENAGNYLCNNIYYEGLKYINKNKLDTKMIFIHVPSINQDFDFDKLAKAISEFIDNN